MELFPSDAEIVNEYVVEEDIPDRVPDINPDEEFKEIPGGRPPAETEQDIVLFSSSVACTETDTELPSLNTPKEPATVCHIGESFTVKIS